MPAQRAVERDARGGRAARGDRRAAADRARGRQGARPATRPGLPQRGAGDRERVDASDLPRSRARARASAISVRRDAQHPLAAFDQKPLQRPRDVPAVLERPHPLAAEARAPSAASAREPVRADRDRLLAEQLAGRRRDRGDRVRALVGVRTEHDHDLVHLHYRLEPDVRRTRLAGGGATLLTCLDAAHAVGVCSLSVRGR